MEKSNDNPLVSIVVVTYNSSKYVLETLESVKAQTYLNIELIISDDCSTDNTIEICRQWIVENKERFVGTEIITVEKNTGISANRNRGHKVSKGEWIKEVAGDDILYSHAIQSYIDFVNKNKGATFIVASVKNFVDNVDNVISIKPLFKMSANKNMQIKQLITGLYISSGGIFIKKQVIEQLGVDEKYKMLDDAPCWFKFLTTGHHFSILEDALYGYRIHSASVTGTGNIGFLKDGLSFKKEIVFPIIKKKRMYLTHLISKWDYALINRQVMGKKNVMLNFQNRIILMIRFGIALQLYCRDWIGLKF